MRCGPVNEVERVTINVPANCTVTADGNPAQVYASPGTFTYTPYPRLCITIRHES
jgi:hypothetical protein